MNATGEISNSGPVKGPEIIEFMKSQDLVNRERTTFGAPQLPESWGTGLALSGGGIRSAVFCLGALQALADRKLLERFTFLSSVSGGGYTAAALQYWWSRSASAYDAAANFPFGTNDPEVADDSKAINPRLKFLRRHGSYLTPGNGLTAASMVAVVLRTLLLNVAIWLPLTALAFWCILLFSNWLQDAAPTVVRRVPNLAFWAVTSDWTNTMNVYGSDRPYLPMPFIFGLAQLVAAFGGAYIAYRALVLAVLSFVSRPDWVGSKGAKLKRYTVAVAVVSAFACLLLSSFLLLPPVLGLGDGMERYDVFSYALTFASMVIMLIVASTLWYASERSNYYWRRSYEVKAGWILVRVAILLAFASAPVLPDLIANKSSFLGGLSLAGLGSVGGVVASLYGHLTQSRNKVSGGIFELVASIGAALFLYAFTVVAYCYAQFIIHPEVFVSTSSINSDLFSGVAFAAIILAAVLALTTNLNHVGLHRFYRDRIMEAFMPDNDAVADGSLTRASDEADNLMMSDAWTMPKPEDKRVPFPIINTNIVLVDDKDPKHRTRGGDSFAITPLFIGSSATGWQDTISYIDRNGALTLPSAMAASGAALNANSGYVGTGVTRSLLVSVALTLLNLNLGFWAARPLGNRRRYRFFTPNHFMPGFTYGLLRWGFRAESSFALLTDGGHFDNLGIYELVRRRLKTIVVVDAEADLETAMPALVSVAQRVQQDFGTIIRLEAQVNALIPVEGRGYPAGARYAATPWFEADIVYDGDPPEAPSGKLFYIKASFVEDADFITKGYKAKDPTFPHQTTVDQFFDAAQFEAYRCLGFASVRDAVNNSSLVDALRA